MEKLTTPWVGSATPFGTPFAPVARSPLCRVASADIRVGRCPSGSNVYVAPADPVQAKMFAFMPVIFTFMFATFPAGLVIYYTWTNLLTVLQQYFIMRREGVEVNLISNIRRKPKPAE